MAVVTFNPCRTRRRSHHPTGLVLGAGGATFEEMAAWQCGDVTGILGESAALAAQDGPLPPLPRLRFGSLPLAVAALLRPHQVPPWVGATAWLPHGQETSFRTSAIALASLSSIHRHAA